MAGSALQRFAEISTIRPAGSARVPMRCAVVLGGSIAGLLAARVLSEHAGKVIIIERDDAATDALLRPGVPHGSQVHALLPAGVRQLERWFDGFLTEALMAGAVRPPADGSGVLTYVNGVLCPNPPDDGVPGLLCTRPFLEHLVRRRTIDLPNVELVNGRAERLVFDGDRVAGARYVPHGTGSAVTIDADLVVDAMGRSSRLGDWLVANGWHRPPMRRMPIKLNYASAMFAYDESIADVCSVVSQAGADTTPDRRPRIGGCLRVERDRWLMLVAGYDDDRPTADIDDYITRCRRDFPPVFGEIARRATMIGGVTTYHQADSRRRDYHRLRRFPAGLVAAGDAVASFNPVYGQGMTAAALHASCLSRYLWSGASLREPATGYFDLVRVVVDAAWQVSAFADLELPHVDGPYPRGYPIMRWLSKAVFHASLTDHVINQRLARIAAMLAHPHSLATPGTVARALLLSATRKRRQVSAGA